MNERLRADAPVLRRIALLALRAAEDDESVRAPMREISTIIDALKNEALLGEEFRRHEVQRLRSLIEKLPRGGMRNDPEGLVRSAVVDELRDLASILREG
ncbi:MAG TPA: hypothetical protein VNL91_06525 [Thermoanaerobaculia bacterium]|nr:hypothetical protein [Thermoanaerobaculia bacterium]